MTLLQGAGSRSSERLPAPIRGFRATDRGRHADTAFRRLVTAAGVAVLVVLAWMIGSTTLESWPVFAKEGLGFLTSTEWRPGSSRTENRF